MSVDRTISTGEVYAAGEPFGILADPGNPAAHFGVIVALRVRELDREPAGRAHPRIARALIRAAPCED